MKQSKTAPSYPRLPNGTRVRTADGDGKTVGMNFRRNTNGGPGVRQYVVMLDDGRVRHYGRFDLTELP